MTGDRLRIAVLGQLSVTRDGIEVPIASSKQRLLLAALASQANRAVSVERLIEILWEDRPPASARANLQTYMHRLRAMLGDGVIVSRPGGYELTESQELCDAVAFERDLGAARGMREGDPVAAVTIYRRALARWRGNAFDGLSDAGPLALAAARLDELRNVARQECVDLELELGRHRSLIPELTAAVASHPMDEHVLAQAMTALHGAGRSSDALELFHRSSRLMSEELGVEPGPALQRLQQAILAQTAGPPTSDEDSGGPAEPVTTPSTPAQLPAAVATFVGREAAVNELAEMLLAPVSGPAIALITGAGGIGKSTLAIHTAHRVADRFPDGQLYVDLRGATPGMAPTPPEEVLTRFVRALAPLEVAAVRDLDELAAHFRSLTAGKRVLLVLDDAADAAQVRPLLPGSATCAVLITSRHALAALGTIHRRPVSELSPGQARLLLGALVGEHRLATDPEATDDVLRWCDRLPLAIGLAGAKLAARPHWSVATLRDRLAADDQRLDELEIEDLGVRRSFGLSCADLSPAGLDLFLAIGCLPTPVLSTEVAAAVLGEPESTTRLLLDELADAHLIQAHAGGRYRIHDLLRLFARELAGSEDHHVQIDAGLRRVLHLYLATARDAPALFGVDNDWKKRLIPAQLARDPLRFDDPESARAWYAAELPAMIDIAAYAAGRPGELPALAVALSVAQRTMLQVLGHWHEARALTLAARDAAAVTGDPLHQAHADQDLAIMECYVGRPHHGLDHAQRAMAYWRTSGDALSQAHGLIALADVMERLDRTEEWFDLTTESLRLRREIGDRQGEAGVLIELSLYHLRAGDLAAAQETTTAAEAIAREIDSRRLRAIALGNTGEIARRSGDVTRAVRSFDEALAADLAAGQGGTVLQAEHWWGLAQSLRQRAGTNHAEAADLVHARECFRRAAELLAMVGLITEDEHHAILASDDPPRPQALQQML